MRLLFLVAVVAGATACGAYNFPSGSSAYGTVAGHVTAVPCSPVQNPDNACTPRLVSGVEIDYTNGGQSFVTRTGPDGTYNIGLPSGTWTVKLKSERMIGGPSTVTVKANATIVADYVVDSGIRMPAPAA